MVSWLLLRASRAEMGSKGPDAVSFSFSFKSGDKLFIDSFYPLVKRILLKITSHLCAMASDFVKDHFALRWKFLSNGWGFLVNCGSRMQCNGPDMRAPILIRQHGNGPVICRVFFVEEPFPFLFSGLLTAKISMSYIVMMKETNIIKDNTIRETVDGLHCHP